jgi:hypothetical protein
LHSTRRERERERERRLTVIMFPEELDVNANRQKQQENQEKRRKIKQQKKKTKIDKHKAQTAANKAAAATAFNKAVPNPTVEFLKTRLVEELKAKLKANQVKKEAESRYRLAVKEATLKYSCLGKLLKQMLMVVDQDNKNLKEELEEKK